MKRITSIVAIIVMLPFCAASAANTPHGAYAGPTPIKFSANHGSPVTLLTAAVISAKEQPLLNRFHGTLQATLLQTYNAFEKSGKYAWRKDTQSLRDVYVARSSFPSGLTTRHTRWSSATVTTVYDAVTGALLQRAVTGSVAQTLRPTRS